MKRELFYMWRDKGLRYILIAGPLLGLFLFMGIYDHPRIDNIPTAIVNLDKSGASRQVVAELKNTQDLEIIYYPNSFEQLEELIKRGQVMVGVVIPENYSKNIALHRQTKVAVVIDGANMTYATNAASAVLTVTRTLGTQVGVKTLIAQGMQPNQAQEAYQSIDFREEAWFNPTLNYAYFLVLPLVLNIWQQCCTLASCMNIIGENGFRSWIQIKSSRMSIFKFFFCKSIVHIFIFMLIILPVYFLAFVVFKLPLNCDLITFLLYTLVFAISLHSVGTLISSLSRSAVDASRFGMVIALPSFVISGYTWPIEAMPQWFQPVAWVFPQTWFFQGINYLVFKNPGWEFMGRYFLILGIMSVICYSLAALFTHGLKARFR
nr:ABC transporter permease [Desulfoscipio gibsoniae]